MNNVSPLIVPLALMETWFCDVLLPVPADRLFKTRVAFKPLSQQEIEHYIDTHHPYDKTGAYGAQDWIGMGAITLVYQHLQKF
jgi:hypothetical protein